jgi:actin-related protein
MANATPLPTQINAVVIEVGHAFTRAGFAGDETPRVVTPSALLHTPRTTHHKTQQDRHALQTLLVDEAPRRAADGATLRTLADEALTAADANALRCELVRHCYAKLQVAADEYAALVPEPFASTAAERADTAAFFFEELRVPALCTPRHSELAALAMGKLTALVVDLGAACTVATAVVDGVAQARSVRTSQVTSSSVAAAFGKALEEWHGASFDAAADAPAGALAAYRRREGVRSAYEALCRVMPDRSNVLPMGVAPTTPYELPDGRVIHVGGSEKTPNKRDERYLFGDAFFNDSKEDALQPLQVLALGAIQAVTYDPHRRDLLRSVVLTGGGSVTVGMPERLETELRSLGQPPKGARRLRGGQDCRARRHVE